jgi:hypothetical protein
LLFNLSVGQFNGVEWKKGEKTTEAAAGVTGLTAMFNKATNGQQRASITTGLLDVLY